MIVVKLQGGLGNQLFQYAIGKSLSLHYDTQLFLDLTHLLDRTPTKDFVFRGYDLDMFNLEDVAFFNDKIKAKFWKKSWIRSVFFSSPIYYKEKGFHFDEALFTLKKGNIYLDGYWQSQKYFGKYESILRSKIKFHNHLTFEQTKLIEDLRLNNSICVNFRRTDYVELMSANKVHGVTPIGFYHKSLQQIKEKTNDVFKIYVFSDDIEWCRKNFIIDDAIYFVEHELYKGDRFSTYLELMSNCKYFIIPNSTFAWWAAWISNAKGENIYVPYQWFKDETLQSQTKDLIPETWNRVTF